MSPSMSPESAPLPSPASVTTLPPRRPAVAMSLSMLCCGLGQIYCGEAGRGLIFASLSLLLGPVVVATASTATSTVMLVLFLVSLVALFGVAIWSIADARRRARAMRGIPFVPRDYNRSVVYVLMAMTGLPYALGLALFLRANVVEAFRIPSASMVPTLVPGDRILVTKLGIAERTLQRGEVVVFRNPQDRNQRYIKRVIGLPGETVEVRDGVILINGEPLKTEPVPAASPTESPDSKGSGARKIEHAGGASYVILDDPGEQETPRSVAPVTVPLWSYYVLGDHRSRSQDSRTFGTVAHSEIAGVLSYLYWPGDRWSRFGRIGATGVGNQAP